MSLPILMPMTFPPARRVESLLPTRDVCPHCKRETAVYRFLTPDGCRIESHTCAEHGDVPPMLSAIVNPALPAAVWDREGP